MTQAKEGGSRSEPDQKRARVALLIPPHHLRTGRRATGRPDGEFGGRSPQPRCGARRSPDAAEDLQSHRVGELFENPKLVNVMERVRERGTTLHLLGLVGPGGVHAVDSHLLALCEMAVRREIPKVRVHAFLDGRDTPPQSAQAYLTELTGRANGGQGCSVATVMGRYWAMDRDRRWERTAAAYNALVYGQGEPVARPRPCRRRRVRRLAKPTSS
jgi:2,3-bisphosphoglycerate-independent phosphoglycerate mutase